MDWYHLQKVICEGRRFTRTDAGCKVLSDTMMPSGHAIHVHIQSRGDGLFMHDGGAAFDELAIHGVDMKSTRGVTTMLRETNFGLNDEGLVFRKGLPFDKAAIGIALVADASVRAAQYMLARGSKPQAIPLDRKLKDALRTRYPAGMADFTFEGQNRQHRFDFGVTVEGETFLVQAVTPDPSSISSAIVKALDARNAPNAHARPVLVFDPDAHWKPSDINMLALGGQSMEIGRISREPLPLAA